MEFAASERRQVGASLLQHRGSNDDKCDKMGEKMIAQARISENFFPAWSLGNYMSSERQKESCAEPWTVLFKCMQWFIINPSHLRSVFFLFICVIDWMHCTSFIILIGNVSKKNTETHSWLSLTDRLRDRWGAKDFLEGWSKHANTQ